MQGYRTLADGEVLVAGKQAEMWRQAEAAAKSTGEVKVSWQDRTAKQCRRC